jgi:hypothetical protein
MLIAGPAAAAQAPDFDHGHRDLAAVLATHVNSGRVDYAGLHRNRSVLDRYVGSLASVDEASLARFERGQQLAYWLNAYNAFVLATIVDHYPIRRGSLAGLAFPSNSIWQIPGAFKAQRFRAGGRRLSLDDIEHRVVRPTFRDPRVHVALVCAARSCPDLRGEPYRAAVLDVQLDEQARRFVADARKGVSFASDRDEVRVSSIFKWFGEDFAPLGPGDAERGVLEFIARYAANADAAARLRSGRLRVRYLDYDWTLNE